MDRREIIRGIEEWDTPVGFHVLRVHYTADPDKDPVRRGKDWFERARRGTLEVDWRKEYEIDWFARCGELVYPEFDKSVHLVDPFVVPDDWTRYMTLDPGLRNPTAALWGALTPENDLVLYREHYHRDKIVKWHAQKILQMEEETGEEVWLRAIDPAAGSRNPATNRSLLDEYRENGLFFIKGKNDVQAGIDRVRKWLQKDDETGWPRIFIFSSLTSTIDEISRYRWWQESEAKLLQSSPGEKPRKKDDHLMDCLRYMVMMEPEYVRSGKKRRRSRPFYESTGY